MAKRTSGINRTAADGSSPASVELARYETLSRIAAESVKAIAIVIGGLWVLYRFGISEYPSLAPAISSNVNIEVAKYEPNEVVCKVFLKAKFSNGSKQTVELTDVSI